ncbi:MAG TPA: hypothetical protein VLC92_11915 [Rhodocyclaceae bacterium]|nr:hypothetical protein [Rhodocyclaceae bacterium]
MKTVSLRTSIAVLCLGMATAASAQYAYPSKGQSADQQKKDDYECRSWATGQTGHDPSKPQQPVAAAPAPVPAGGRARGAAAGAVVAGIADEDVGKGAAVGMVAGGVAQRGQRRQQARAQDAQNQQAAAATQQGNAAFQNAWGACMGGRGYSLK